MTLLRHAWVAPLLLLLLPTPAQADHVPDGLQWACGFGGSGRTGHPDDCGIDPVGGEGVGSDGEPEWGDAWIDDVEPLRSDIGFRCARIGGRAGMLRFHGRDSTSRY